ncbi:MAG: mechanosensitive ion channel domain-containing protein, partial [Candidatus Latescibacterota bacterium]
GSILMTFDRIRQLGTAILASAGVAGIIIGVAAQRSVANLLAGIQIALTETVRLDDSVIVEGEYGNVEEITLTYIVVKLWDNRRMVLPIMYFIEKPFLNLTRVHTNLLGTVYLYLDYTIPANDIRNELHRLLKESPKWDGTAYGLSVTNLKEKTMELRALVSAKNSDDLWDLRCDIREKLIYFIRRNYPDVLPKIRLQMEKGKPNGEA